MMKVHNNDPRFISASLGALENAPREYLFKRPIDVCLSFLGLLLSSPLWVVISIAILLEDGAPIFYRSSRVGKGGKPFEALKFRTMIRDSDSRFGPLQAGENDKRITRVGKIIRPMALDELPQLWSIFTGDMSFVGPRALVPAEIEQRDESSEPVPIEEIPGYYERH